MEDVPEEMRIVEIVFHFGKPFAMRYPGEPLVRQPASFCGKRGSYPSHGVPSMNQHCSATFPWAWQSVRPQSLISQQGIIPIRQVQDSIMNLGSLAGRDDVVLGGRRSGDQ